MITAVRKTVEKLLGDLTKKERESLDNLTDRDCFLIVVNYVLCRFQENALKEQEEQQELTQKLMIEG